MKENYYWILLGVAAGMLIYEQVKKQTAAKAVAACLSIFCAFRKEVLGCGMILLKSSNYVRLFV